MLRSMSAGSRERVRAVEIRVLDGPNLYFPRPAIKLTLAVEEWLEMPADRAVATADRLGHRVRMGRPASEQRRRATAALATTVARRIARATGIRLAVRARLGER